MNDRSLKPSLLHRVCRLRPGSVPNWFASRHSCEGLDILIAFDVAFAVAGVLLWQHAVLPSVVLITTAVMFVAFVHMPFESVERFARARRRRGECVACGQKLRRGEQRSCLSCDM